MSDLPPLPPDLRNLFDEERGAYEESDAARARVLRRIEASVAFGAVGIGAGALVAAKTGLWSTLLLHVAKHAKLWLAMTFAAGATAGVVVGETHARFAAPAPIVVPAPPAIPKPSAFGQSASVDPPAISIGSLPSVPSAPPPVTLAPPPVSTLAAEQSLIETARSALARGRADDALRATSEHEKQFPRGRLAEERELLAIQALVQAGRTSDAEARAKRFHAAYPSSLYGSAVDALVVPREDKKR